MSTVIRLARHGSKKNAFYKIVVIDQRKKTTGRFTELIGKFNPHNESETTVNLEAFKSWIGKGAQPSKTVLAIVKKIENNATAA